MTRRRPFEPVARATISERVRDDIHGRIASGEIAPGTRLPAERTLADQFGVARTSIREAIQGLVALGVIERRGNRSYTAEQVKGSELPASDGGKRSLRALLEARRVLELCLFEFAAIRATSRDRNETLELARRPIPAGLEGFSLADREFHAGIAGACGNPVLVEVYGRVIDTLLATDASTELMLGLGEGIDPRSAIREVADDHRAIAEAYAAGEVAAMLDAADRHLGRVQERIGRLSRRLVPAAGREAHAARRTVGL